MDEKINILIVDDEQIILDSIERHLRNEADLDAFKALSVEESLELMKELRIDIILTDLMMPDIDGLEFIKIVKERYPQVIMIMITGYATINSALQAMQLGAFDYIAKPFTRDELKKVVRRAADLVLVSRNNDAGDKQISIGHETAHEKMIKVIGEHTWLMVQEDGNVLIGVERPFLINIGRIQTLYLPSEGDELRQGSTYFQVFSTDLRSESLLSPLSGEVIEINRKVVADPNRALQDPYDEGWLVRIKPAKFDEEIKLLGL